MKFGSTDYKVKVSSDPSPSSYGGTGIYTLSIDCSGIMPLPLLITEVREEIDWIVIYNAGSGDVQMSDISLYATTTSPLGLRAGFPSYTLGGGARVRFSDSATSAVDDLNFAAGLPWATSGAIEIVRTFDWNGSDFVRWGTATASPLFGELFTGTAPSTPASGTGIRRIFDINGRPFDSDNATDWRPVTYRGESESNDTLSAANCGITTPVIITGSITAGDSDYFKIRNSSISTQSYSFTTYRPIGGSAFDSYLDLYTMGGSYVTSDDDSGEGTYSHIHSANLSAGSDYVIRVRGFSSGSTGDYTLFVTGPFGISTTASMCSGGLTVVVQ